VVCLAPRAREDSVRPRRLSGASGRPLNFTVRRRKCASPLHCSSLPDYAGAAVPSQRDITPLVRVCITGTKHFPSRMAGRAYLKRSRCQGN
jgi:hypothetical protein